MSNKILFSSLLATASAFLIACGDSGNGGGTQSLAGGVESFDDLPACSKNREGDTAVVVEDSLTYICVNGKWDIKKHVIDTVKTEEDLPACSKSFEGDSAYVSGEYAVYVCSGNTWEKTGTTTKTYGSLDDMPNCTKKLAGVEALSTADSAIFLCNGERWKEMAKTYSSDRDLPNCTEKREGSLAYLKETGEKFLCSGKKWSAIEEWTEDSEGPEKPESSSGNSSGQENESSSSSAEEPSSSSEAFLCGTVEYDPESSFCDTRDSTIYRLVTIGTQTWMAENLNYYNKSLNNKSWCNDNNPDNCELYGRLYNYDAAKNVCPEGWHLPYESEWNVLVAAVGGQDVAGQKLKARSGWNESNKGTDAVGFSGLPAGCRWEGDFSVCGFKTSIFWTPEIGGKARIISLYQESNLIDISSFNVDSESGFSVRCVQD